MDIPLSRLRQVMRGDALDDSPARRRASRRRTKAGAAGAAALARLEDDADEGVTDDTSVLRELLGPRPAAAAAAAGAADGGGRSGGGDGGGSEDDDGGGGMDAVQELIARAPGLMAPIRSVLVPRRRASLSGVEGGAANTTTAAAAAAATAGAGATGSVACPRKRKRPAAGDRIVVAGRYESFDGAHTKVLVRKGRATDRSDGLDDDRRFWSTSDRWVAPAVLFAAQRDRGSAPNGGEDVDADLLSLLAQRSKRARVGKAVRFLRRVADTVAPETLLAFRAILHQHHAVDSSAAGAVACEAALVDLLKVDHAELLVPLAEFARASRSDVDSVS